jgi:endonuclease YncB( thermonuclease family)
MLRRSKSGANQAEAMLPMPSEILRGVLLVALLSTAALAEGGRSDSSRIVPEGIETVDGRTLVVLNGDTLSVPGKDRIRLFNIDAPATVDFRCERELILGLKAKQRLVELVRSGLVSIERRDKDPYRRTLGYVRLGDGRDVGRVLLAEGLVAPYRPDEAGEAENLALWCGSAARAGLR